MDNLYTGGETKQEARQNAQSLCQYLTKKKIKIANEKTQGPCWTINVLGKW